MTDAADRVGADVPLVWAEDTWVLASSTRTPTRTASRGSSSRWSTCPRRSRRPSRGAARTVPRRARQPGRRGPDGRRGRRGPGRGRRRRRRCAARGSVRTTAPSTCGARSAPATTIGGRGPRAGTQEDERARRAWRRAGGRPSPRRRGRGPRGYDEELERFASGDEDASPFAARRRRADPPGPPGDIPYDLEQDDPEAPPGSGGRRRAAPGAAAPSAAGDRGGRTSHGPGHRGQLGHRDRVRRPARGPGYDVVLVARDEARLRAVGRPARRARRARARSSSPTSPTRRPGPASSAASPSPPTARRRSTCWSTTPATARRGEFTETDPAVLAANHEVNVSAVMLLCRAALPGMVARGRGGVINLSSVAGFLPGRGSVYGAGKAYVTALSQNLYMSVVRHRGARHGAVPGLHEDRVPRAPRAGPHGPGFLWLEADRVVADGLADFAKGKAAVGPGGGVQGDRRGGPARPDADRPGARPAQRLRAGLTRPLPVRTGEWRHERPHEHARRRRRGPGRGPRRPRPPRRPGPRARRRARPRHAVLGPRGRLLRRHAADHACTTRRRRWSGGCCGR